MWVEMEGHLTDSMIRIMVNICDDLEGYKFLCELLCNGWAGTCTDNKGTGRFRVESVDPRDRKG